MRVTRFKKAHARAKSSGTRRPAAFVHSDGTQDGERRLRPHFATDCRRLSPTVADRRQRHRRRQTSASRARARVNHQLCVRVVGEPRSGRHRHHFAVRRRLVYFVFFCRAARHFERMKSRSIILITANVGSLFDDKHLRAGWLSEMVKVGDNKRAPRSAFICARSF